MNLRVRMNIACAGLVLVIVIGTMLSLYMSEKKQLWADVQEEQRDDLAKLERVYQEAMVGANEVIFFNYVKTLAAQPHVAYAGFVEESGSGWIYRGGVDQLVFADMSDSLIRKILASGRLIQQKVKGSDGEPVIEMSKPFLGKTYIRLAYSEKAIRNRVASRLNKSLRRITILGYFAVLFGLILAHLLSRYLSKPIMNLMKATNAIAAGEKGVTIPEAGHDELGTLTRMFNHMSLELMKLDKMKDDFMSHVTHELRSPLTSIIATVDLLDEMPIADSNPRFRRSIDRLKYGSERLNRLVDNILDLTRMEAGKMQFDIQPINIGTIAYEMADFFEARAMEKNLYIHADVPRALPFAMGDSEKIRQVLSNLIHNAIKFTNTGGVTVWVKPVGEEIHVGVRDTGIGIPKENLESVFSKFETLKDTKDRVKKHVPGSGLGLNIVLHSIKAQQGRIWVESEVDQGTTFVFALPIAKGIALAKPKPIDKIGRRSVEKDQKSSKRGFSLKPVINERDEAV